MRLLVNPMVLRMGMLLLAASAAFTLGLFLIRRLRKTLVAEPESLHRAPLAAEGLPIHAYHAVIQQLKQQKHELTAQQLSERRKAKASDTLSSTILSNLSCGVLFLNTSGLVRQTNAAARQLLGFASPVGLHSADLFRSATLRPGKDPAQTLCAATPDETFEDTQLHPAAASVEQALAPALAGKAAVRGLLLNYVTRDGISHVLELTASPVLAEDASLMGTTLVLNDKTDLERIRHDQKMNREISTELLLVLRTSVSAIATYAQQMAHSRDPEQARRVAESIAGEAAQLNCSIAEFLGSARAATTST